MCNWFSYHERQPLSMSKGSTNVRVGDSNTGVSRGVELGPGEPFALNVNSVSEVYPYGNGIDKIVIFYLVIPFE